MAEKKIDSPAESNVQHLMELYKEHLGLSAGRKTTEPLKLADSIPVPKYQGSSDYID